MLVDNDSFDRVPLSARKARFAPWCRAPQAERNVASGQESPASGGVLRPAIKWVIINEHWYYTRIGIKTYNALSSAASRTMVGELASAITNRAWSPSICWVMSNR